MLNRHRVDVIERPGNAGMGFSEALLIVGKGWWLEAGEPSCGALA
jgi:hypothetical protein